MCSKNVRPSFRNSRFRCENIISILIRAGADVNARNHFGQTPLHTLIAIYTIPLSSINELIESGADLDAVDRSGNTLLHSASNKMRDGREFINLLVQKGGIDVNVVNNLGETPLYQASQSSSDWVVSYLLGIGADISILPDDGVTHLHHAALRFDQSLMSVFIDAGIDVNVTDTRGRTPLHFAAVKTAEFFVGGRDRGWEILTVFFLIENGTDIHAEDQGGWTPFLQMANLEKRDRIRYNEFMRFVGWCDRVIMWGALRRKDYCFGSTPR